MDKKLLSIFLALGSSLFASEQNRQIPPPPEYVEKQLAEATKEYEEVAGVYKPWYAGPLLTPSPHIVPVGLLNIQPYYFFVDNKGKYNQDTHSQKIPHFIQHNPAVVVQIGVLSNWVDFVIVPSYYINRQSGHSATGWADLPVGLGFQLLRETPEHVAIEAGVQETIPIGKYDHLHADKGGIDGIGGGAWITRINLNTGKVVYWITGHPMNTRLSFNYFCPAHAYVKGINAYGGDKETHGKVRVGQNFTGYLGLEFSLTQRWVLPLDVVYTYSSKTTFSGKTTAPVGGPFHDQLSLAPGLEYNLTENLGFLAGPWFSVWGRNSFDFISWIATFEYTF